LHYGILETIILSLCAPRSRATKGGLRSPPLGAVGKIELALDQD
jgi:hypothetical protein